MTGGGSGARSSWWWEYGVVRPIHGGTGNADAIGMREQLFAPAGQLFFGDNLEVMPRHVETGTVDLVYLDPPFNSNRTYNLLFSHKDGRRAAAQIKAFDDSWTWDEGAAALYDEIVRAGGDTGRALQAFRALIGSSDMLAYLTMMAPRIEELHRVLKPTGSLYLHCDPSASHYLKMLLDAVFGPENFQNEVIWHYRTFHGAVKRYYPRKHDTLLFYSKSQSWKFNQLRDEDDLVDTIDYKRWGRYLQHGNRILGDNMPMQDTRFLRFHRRWVRENGRDPGPTDVVYEVQGQPVDTVWDIQALDPKDKTERLGYPTQKPIELLERIILASTDPGDVILDPFCGCGTTIDAAQRLGRQWIGIDVTALAIEIIQDRLAKYHPNVDYVLRGEPSTIDEAHALAELDKHEFQRWVCRRLDVKPPKKKGADRGIDGEMFGVRADGSPWRAIVEVKGGGVKPEQIRSLRGTVTREEAALGFFVTLKAPTAAMKKEAIDAGFFESGVPVMQIITVADLLEGRGPVLPAAEAKQRRRLRAV